MVFVLSALVLLLSVVVWVLLVRCWRAEASAAKYRSLTLRGLAEMEAAIGAAVKQV